MKGGSLNFVGFQALALALGKFISYSTEDCSSDSHNSITMLTRFSKD